MKDNCEFCKGKGTVYEDEEGSIYCHNLIYHKGEEGKSLCGKTPNQIKRIQPDKPLLNEFLDYFKQTEGL